MSETALFRPAKRKKVSRRHVQADEESSEVLPPSLEAANDPGNDSKRDDIDMSGILKMRRRQRSRAGGVQFSNTKAAPMGEDPSSSALIPVDDSTERLKAISDRFVGHSGQIVDVDKHMMAYIESKMDKRHNTAIPTTAGPDPDLPSSEGEPTTRLRTYPPARQPASLGLLNEVDLGTSSTASNAARTSAALLRAAAGEPIIPSDPPPAKPRKPRLDRYGRPMPPRRPRAGNRRNSEDLRRDALVDEIMKESRLEIYDEPVKKTQDEDGDADERIAQQFRQEFLDAVANRHAQQQQKKMPVGKGEEGQKGPKWGGSRSARAAMRERELREAKDKEKKK